jgi:hypothetical protein
MFILIQGRLPGKRGKRESRKAASVLIVSATSSIARPQSDFQLLRDKARFVVNPVKQTQESLMSNIDCSIMHGIMPKPLQLAVKSLVVQPES